MSRRDDNIAEAAQALCFAKHPSHTRAGTRYCSECLRLTMAAVSKLEELGWQDAEAISDEVSNAMVEG